MPKTPPVPPMPGMTDTLEFVKNLWGGMNVPGAGTGASGAAGAANPAMSVEELDKRIADLKAVESWLNMNMTMLRGTIQALEVQRGTIATLQSMSASMAQAMSQGGEQAAAMAAQFFAQPGAAAPATPGAAPQPGAASKPQGAQGGQPGTAEGAMPGMPAAMAWWNMLQDQFKSAVENAMTAQDAAAKFATGAKPAEPGKGGTEETGGGFAQPGTPNPKKSGNNKD